LRVYSKGSRPSRPSRPPSLLMTYIEVQDVDIRAGAMIIVPKCEIHD
jgi:hypothetical protein